MSLLIALIDRPNMRKICICSANGDNTDPFLFLLPFGLPNRFPLALAAAKPCLVRIEI